MLQASVHLFLFKATPASKLKVDVEHLTLRFRASMCSSRGCDANPSVYPTNLWPNHSGPAVSVTGCEALKPVFLQWKHSGSLRCLPCRTRPTCNPNSHNIPLYGRGKQAAASLSAQPNNTSIANCLLSVSLVAVQLKSLWACGGVRA